MTSRLEPQCSTGSAPCENLGMDGVSPDGSPVEVYLALPADPDLVRTRNALPLDGMTGGLPENIIPKWMDNGAINVTRVSGVNPNF